ncbi:hypothetical protein SAMN05216522_106213 [Rosenbergiella nectarea]|uniref:Uncharacterized protein n=1 Tax=Rosenbergiella nectarea TaxID=988801 RepID=A0A1H9IWI1_9GAMM|nr:hypothetical protein SAMN05216522_106213 [Rosenbergiella nectarea]
MRRSNLCYFQALRKKANARPYLGELPTFMKQVFPYKIFPLEMSSFQEEWIKRMLLLVQGITGWVCEEIHKLACNNTIYFVRDTISWRAVSKNWIC